MKQLNLFLIIIVLSSLSLKSQNILTIEISGISSNKGKVLLELRDGEDKFVKGLYAEIVNHKCILIVDDLKVGKYSFSYFHDENNNEKLDKNFLGMPIEGFGFSNNAKGRFGPPAFEKTVFELKKTVNQKCNSIYL